MDNRTDTDITIQTTDNGLCHVTTQDHRHGRVFAKDVDLFSYPWAPAPVVEDCRLPHAR